MSESPHPHPQNPLTPAGSEDRPDSSPIPIPPPVPVRPRLDGWTAERQRAFIEHLADGATVAAACAAVGMSEQSAYRLRGRPDAAAFDAAWVGVVERRRDAFIETAIDRAINGATRARYWKGERVGEERVPSDRLLIWLIRQGHQLAATGRDRLERAGALADRISELTDASDETPPRYRVWECEITGEYRTNAPPPPGFGGFDTVIPYGQSGYFRALTDDECDAWEARTFAAPDAGDEAARRAFFGLDGG